MQRGWSKPICRIPNIRRASNAYYINTTPPLEKVLAAVLDIAWLQEEVHPSICFHGSGRRFNSRTRLDRDDRSLTGDRRPFPP